MSPRVNRQRTDVRDERLRAIRCLVCHVRSARGQTQFEERDVADDTVGEDLSAIGYHRARLPRARWLQPSRWNVPGHRR